MSVIWYRHYEGKEIDPLCVCVCVCVCVPYGVLYVFCDRDRNTLAGNAFHF
jgi:hypothetical protein